MKPQTWTTATPGRAAACPARDPGMQANLIILHRSQSLCSRNLSHLPESPCLLLVRQPPLFTPCRFQHHHRGYCHPCLVLLLLGLPGNSATITWFFSCQPPLPPRPTPPRLLLPPLPHPLLHPASLPNLRPHLPSAHPPPLPHP